MAKSIALLTLLMAVIPAQAPQTRISSMPALEQRITLAPGSPLAATMTKLYGVAGDGALVTRPADLSTGWMLVPLERPVAVNGLALDGDALLITDRRSPAVLRLDLASGRVTMIHEGPPLMRPADVAAAGGAIYVADESRLFRLTPDTPPREVTASGSTGSMAPLFLTSTGNSVIVSSPSDGRVFEYAEETKGGRKPNFSTMQRGTVERAPQARVEDDTLQRRAFPEVQRPGRIAFRYGVTYVIDQNAAKTESARPSQLTGLYAFGRHDRRLVRLVRNPQVPGQPVPPVSSVAVNPDALFVLKGTQVERWPRLVPAEINLPQSNWSEIMTAVYGYLLNHRILPLRQVGLKENVENTLKAEGVLPAAYVVGLTPILCRANPSLCTKEGDFRAMQENDRLWVPDANSEQYVDTMTDDVPPGKTLGEWVDTLVISDKFVHFRSEEKLREYNEKAAYESQKPLRARRGGTYVVPVEFRRYVTAIDAADTPPAQASPLTRLVKTYRGVAIRSQEERPAAASEVARPDAEQDPDLKALKINFAKMLKTIDYFAPPQWLQTPKIGIAEDLVDEDHPDFVNQGVRAWVPEDDSIRAEEAGAAAVAPVTHRIRGFERSDHGTMVGGLIGARHMEFEASGLAPKAMLYHIHSSEPQIGEDIRRAFNRGVRIFNISAHYGIGKVPASLEERLNANVTALFVVAAGNDVVPGRAGAVCRDFTAFPVCWASRQNVIVVTATDAAGDVVLAPIANVNPIVPGANWNPTVVHIAAPGDGFYAPGMGRSYVPARGSSFAAPLVTAVAAMLYAQRIFDPWAIKQRILSTADPVSGLSGKVFAGRVNVRRAVEYISVGVLTRAPRDGVPARTVRLDIDGNARISVRVGDADDDLPIRLSKLLRIHRTGSSYRVVYMDSSGIQILENVTFRSQNGSKFRSTLSDNGQRMDVDLTEWDDYVGPVPVI